MGSSTRVSMSASATLCIFSEQDALVTACAEQCQQHQQQHQHVQNQSASPSSISPSGITEHPSQLNGNTLFLFVPDGSDKIARSGCTHQENSCLLSLISD